jgi:hypothetical protein
MLSVHQVLLQSPAAGKKKKKEKKKGNINA